MILKDGKTYAFSIEGLGAVDLGVSEISAVGQVFDLSDVSKFPGTFTAAKAVGSLAARGSGPFLRNRMES